MIHNLLNSGCKIWKILPRHVHNFNSKLQELFCGSTIEMIIITDTLIKLHEKLIIFIGNQRPLTSKIVINLISLLSSHYYYPYCYYYIFSAQVSWFYYLRNLDHIIKISSRCKTKNMKKIKMCSRPEKKHCLKLNEMCVPFCYTSLMLLKRNEKRERFSSIHIHIFFMWAVIEHIKKNRNQSRLSLCEHFFTRSIIIIHPIVYYMCICIYDSQALSAEYKTNLNCFVITSSVNIFIYTSAVVANYM